VACVATGAEGKSGGGSGMAFSDAKFRRRIYALQIGQINRISFLHFHVLS